ncbi:pyridoxal 5'-phosphate synthase glutaminase subunit PdxT [Promineifilum sp.]|uniref:pyridoxal 5'-phosphate synthase glutaminase subunit PdxT n=1 Tax=Promineifilum sp. TaxID=2664178 RepID=UPI0035AFFBB9
MTKIGVLALQGAFIEHIAILRRLGVEAVEVRLPEDLEGLDGLIIPGGESTTIGKLADTYALTGPLRDFAARKPVWGTCAGMIFMAKDIGREQPLLGVMDIVVERNAFGRQVDSFITPIEVNGFNGSGPFPAVFIRGPRLVEAHGDAEVIARLADGTPVAAREGHWLVTSFHPELTEDARFHELFVRLVEERD